MSIMIIIETYFMYTDRVELCSPQNLVWCQWDTPNGQNAHMLGKEVWCQWDTPLTLHACKSFIPFRKVVLPRGVVDSLTCLVGENGNLTPCTGVIIVQHLLSIPSDHRIGAKALEETLHVLEYTNNSFSPMYFLHHVCAINHMEVENKISSPVTATRKRRHSSHGSTTSKPPEKKAPAPVASTSYATAAAKPSEANKKKRNRKGGIRSDEALRKRGCHMVYYTKAEGASLTFDEWREVEANLHDVLNDADPNWDLYPKTDGYPNIVRSAFAGGQPFLAARDANSAEWARDAVDCTLEFLGHGRAKVADKARFDGKAIYVVTLPDRALVKGPASAVTTLVRVNNLPGVVEAASDLMKPSAANDKRLVCFLYVALDKTAEEAVVKKGLRCYWGVTEVKFQRKRRAPDGSFVDPSDLQPVQ